MSIRMNIDDVRAALAVAIFLSGLTVAAEERKEVSYTVGPGAVVSITNPYGAITVKPSKNREVVVQTVSHSDAVGFVNEQHGSRLELRSVSTRPGSDQADYLVLVPADAVVCLRSSDGALHAQGLRGDIILEGATAAVEATDINDAHLHVRTLSGPITLTDIRNSRLDVRSVNGTIRLHNVTGPSVEVNAGRGRITYEGDPGARGDYLLSGRSGDIDVSIPARAAVDIRTRTAKAQSDEAFPPVSTAPGLGNNLLLKPGTVLGSRFEVRSFSGKIRIRRP
jgi:putative adhesin